MVQEQVFLKRGAGAVTIKFLQGLSFLHLEIILLFAKLCYAFKRKQNFLQGRSHWEEQGAMALSLQFPNQTRSNSFSLKYQEHCFLPMFRNYTDQKFHDL